MRNCVLMVCLFVSLNSFAATTQNSGTRDWRQVEGLGPHTRIHIKSDKENAVCFVHFADEQQLTCARSEAIGSTLLVFPRAEVKSIKLSKKSIGTAVNTSYVDDLFDGPLIYQR